MTASTVADSGPPSTAAASRAHRCQSPPPQWPRPRSVSTISSASAAKPKRASARASKMPAAWRRAPTDCDLDRAVGARIAQVGTRFARQRRAADVLRQQCVASFCGQRRHRLGRAPAAGRPSAARRASARAALVYRPSPCHRPTARSPADGSSPCPCPAHRPPDRHAARPRRRSTPARSA